MQRMKRLVSLLAFGAALLVVAAPVASAEEVVVQVAPATLLLSSTQSGQVTVHVTIAYSRVDLSRAITLNGIPSSWTFADSRGELVAKFDEVAVKAIVAAPSATLTLTGVTVDGESFEGSDTVRVVP